MTSINHIQGPDFDMQARSLPPEEPPRLTADIPPFIGTGTMGRTWDALEENIHAKLKQYTRSHTARAQLYVGPSSPTERCWVKLETLKVFAI